LDTELVEGIKTEAKLRHCSMAQVIRTAILEMMEKRNKESKKNENQ
jgi:hypothetical protein